jgi:hypothetical protein
VKALSTGNPRSTAGTEHASNPLFPPDVTCPMSAFPGLSVMAVVEVSACPTSRTGLDRDGSGLIGAGWCRDGGPLFGVMAGIGEQAGTADAVAEGEGERWFGRMLWDAREGARRGAQPKRHPLRGSCNGCGPWLRAWLRDGCTLFFNGFTMVAGLSFWHGCAMVAGEVCNRCFWLRGCGSNQP